MRVVNTRPQQTKTTLRFCRSVEIARTVPIDAASDEVIQLNLAEMPDTGTVSVEDDRIQFVCSGHAIVDLLVIFQN